MLYNNLLEFSSVGMFGCMAPGHMACHHLAIATSVICFLIRYNSGLLPLCCCVYVSLKALD